MLVRIGTSWGAGTTVQRMALACCWDDILPVHLALGFNKLFDIGYLDMVRAMAAFRMARWVTTRDIGRHPLSWWTEGRSDVIWLRILGSITIIKARSVVVSPEDNSNIFEHSLILAKTLEVICHFKSRSSIIYKATSIKSNTKVRKAESGQRGRGAERHNNFK